MSEAEDFEFRLRMEREAQPTAAPSLADKIVGSAPVRLAMGAVAAPVKAIQLGANIGDMLSPYVPGYQEGQPKVGEWVNKKLSDIEASKQRGMQSFGNEGYDWLGLGGSLLSAGPITKGVSSAASSIAPALTNLAGKEGAKALMARMLLGSVQGGVAGGLQPITDASSNSDVIEKTGLQTMLSGALGGVLPAVTAGIGKIGSTVKQAAQPFYEKGRAAILKQFQEAMMQNDPALKAQYVQAASQAKPGMGGVMPTLGETLAGLPDKQLAARSTGLAAHQEDIAKIGGVSPDFTAQQAAQEAAHASALVPIARNEGALAGEQAVRNTVTATMRDRALGAVNERGEVARTVSDKLSNLRNLTAKQQQMVEALSQPSVKRTLVSEGPSNALKSAVDIHAPYAPPDLQGSVEKVAGAHFQSRMADTLARQAKDRGVAQSNVTALTKVQEMLGSVPVPPPLKADTLIRQINSRLTNPEVEGSPYTQKTMVAIKDHLSAMADEHGIIDARSLYQFKKEGVNQVIDATMDKTNPRFAEKFRGGELIGLKKSIDDAIESAGGKGWKDYLAKYQELSAGPNRMEAGQAVQKALLNPLETGERGQAFAKSLKELDLSALTDPDKKVLSQIASELAKRDTFNKLAGKTSIGGKDAIPGDIGLPLPNLLWRPSMIANFMMKHFAKGAEDKIAKVAGQQYLDPRLFADAMKDVPPRYQPMLEALMQQAPAAAGTTTGRQF